MHIVFESSESKSEPEQIPKRILTSEAFISDEESNCGSGIELNDDDEDELYKLTNTDFILREYKRIKRLYRGSSYESLADEEYMDGSFNGDKNYEEYDSCYGLENVEAHCSSKSIDSMACNSIDSSEAETSVVPDIVEDIGVKLKQDKILKKNTKKLRFRCFFKNLFKRMKKTKKKDH
ncbi:uncharacterized protein [Parasteatoda tepidariorum]|uniref:uncharacterized protein n=1 Tax=Parasteatoda tepidariorum TaxID=114398 RepID=UPI001C71D507|nr:uncharacterized protein LOC122272038 [Parasteatoda tepidariorum]